MESPARLGEVMALSRPHSNPLDRHSALTAFKFYLFIYSKQNSFNRRGENAEVACINQNAKYTF